MRGVDKTKKQLINGMVQMHQRITKLEASKTERKRAEEGQDEV